jgi:hypothetical protein
MSVVRITCSDLSLRKHKRGLASHQRGPRWRVERLGEAAGPSLQPSALESFEANMLYRLYRLLGVFHVRGPFAGPTRLSAREIDLLQDSTRTPGVGAKPLLHDAAAAMVRSIASGDDLKP